MWSLRKKNFEQQLLQLQVRPRGRNFIMLAKQDTALWAFDAVRYLCQIFIYAQLLPRLTDRLESEDRSIRNCTLYYSVFFRCFRPLLSEW